MEEPGSVEILQFEPRHAEGVRELARSILCDEYKVLESLDDQPDLQDIESHYGPPRSRMVVVLEHGVIVGSCGLHGLAETVCELRRLYVRQDHRRLGLASQMFAQLLPFVHEQGYKTILLEIRPEMEPDTDVYRRYGFQDVGDDPIVPREGHFMAIRFP